MFAQKLLLPALALAGAVAAGPSDSQPTLCSKPTASVTNGADAGALAACTSFPGTIVVDSAAAGIIALDGPKQVGGITVNNAQNLNGLTSTSIQSVTGTFMLSNLTSMSSLQFDQLTSVNTINWSGLKGINQLTFGKPVSQASSVSITNTRLTTLDGINLDSVDTFFIANNPLLNTISTQVGNVGTLSIFSNGSPLTIQLPNLEWAVNAILSNATTLQIPSLATVNESLSINSNFLESLSAPNLTTIGDKAKSIGDFTFNANNNVKNLTLPRLTTIAGGININNNTNLFTINLPVLNYVGGALNFNGNFSTPNMPALKDVRGAFDLVSASDVDCDHFSSEHGANNVIQGQFSCTANADHTSTTGGGSDGGSGTSSGSGASPTKSKGAAVSYGVSETVAGLSVLGGLLQMLL